MEEYTGNRNMVGGFSAVQWNCRRSLVVEIGYPLIRGIGLAESSGDKLRKHGRLIPTIGVNAHFRVVNYHVVNLERTLNNCSVGLSHAASSSSRNPHRHEQNTKASPSCIRLSADIFRSSSGVSLLIASIHGWTTKSGCRRRPICSRSRCAYVMSVNVYNVMASLQILS